MEAIRHETGFVMEQIRRLIGELSPPEDHDFFPAGLEALVGQFKELTDIAVGVRVSGEVARLDPARQQILRAVLQEALTNVAKHARARSAAITVEVRDDEVGFEVVDDGAGSADDVTSAAARPGGHYGLRQMRERVESIGGRLAHGPHTPAGFRVAGAFPLTTR
jgi:two-component system NarL family sensor kinase